MAIESNLAGVARVAFEAQTAEFNRDVDKAERVYVSSTEHMSDSAIKLELAQDRLRRSLAKGPNAAREQARALLAVRQAERELAGQTDKTTRELQQQERQMGRVTRGVVAGSGVFHGLGRSVAFASGTFLGGAGLVYALRSTLEAGRDAEASQGRVAVAVRNAGLEYGRYRDQITQTITKQSQLSAFDDEDLSDAFAKVVIRTRDVGKALEALDTITNTARGRQISLEAATQLWIKASLGQVGQLRRVGIEVAKNATAQELLTKLQETYAGQAVRYGREGAGAQERLGVAIENTEETIAQGLLPTVTDLSNEISDWLSKSKNQERLQHDVNAAVKTGTSVVKGLADGLRIVKDVAEPVVDALGGIEKAAQLALIVGIVAKARKAALGFLPLQASSAATATKGVRDAAIFGRAWDVATRPRVMTVAERIAPYGGGPGVPAPGPTTTRGGRFPKIPFTLGLNGPTAVAGAVLISGGAQGGRQDAYTPKKYPRIASALAQAERDGEYPPGFLDVVREALGGNFNGKSIRDLTPAQLQRIETNLRPQRVGAEGGDRDRPNQGRAVDRPARRPTTRGGRGGRRGDGLSPIQRLELTASQAELTTNDLRDDLKAARDIEAHYAKIASNEKLKGDKLFQARQDLLQAQQRTKGIEDQIAADRQAAEETAAAKRRADREKLAATRKRIREAEARETARMVKATEDALPGNSPYANTSKGFAKGAITPAEARRRTAAAKAKAPDDSITQLRQEMGDIFRDFMQWQIDVLKNGSNVLGGNLPTHVLEQLTREQTGVMKQAFLGPRTPRRELDEAVMAW